MAKREQNQRHYARNKQKIEQKNARWRQNNPERWAFLMQRQHAKQRGIEFLFEFQEWLDWWGDDFANRGCKVGQLVMARFNDEGPYAPDNVTKVTCSLSASDSNKSVGKEIVKPAQILA